MSYCRWSSNDGQCDVYCYESCYGFWTVHVARNKRIVTEELPPPLDLNMKDGFADAFLKRHKEVTDILGRMQLVPIGLSRDGESFDCDTPLEAAELLESLRDEGYRVPQHAIDALREEAAHG